MPDNSSACTCLLTTHRRRRFIEAFASYCEEKDGFELLMDFNLSLKRFDALFELRKFASHSEDQLPEILFVHFCQGISD